MSKKNDINVEDVTSTSQYDGMQVLKDVHSLPGHYIRTKDSLSLVQPYFDDFTVVFDENNNPTEIKYFAGTKSHITEIGCLADNNSNLAGTYVLISSGRKERRYALYITVDGVGTPPNLAGVINLEVSISANDSSQIVALALKQTIDSIGSFKTKLENSVVTATTVELGVTNNTIDVGTSFIINNTSGERIQVEEVLLQYSTSGNPIWQSQEFVGYKYNIYTGKLVLIDVNASLIGTDGNQITSTTVDEKESLDVKINTNVEDRLLYETFPLLDNLILPTDSFDSYILRKDSNSKFVTAHFFTNGEQQFRLVQGFDIQEDVGTSRLPATSFISDLIFSQGDNPSNQPAGEIVGALFAIGGQGLTFNIIQDPSSAFSITNNVITQDFSLPQGEYPIVVQVVDFEGNELNKTIKIIINDESLISNVFLSETNVDTSILTIGSNIGIFSTLGGQEPITYTLLDQRLTDSNGAVIDYFEIVGDKLKLKNNIMDPSGTVYYIRVQAEDNRSALDDEDRIRFQDFFLVNTVTLFENNTRLQLNGIDEKGDLPSDSSLRVQVNFSVSIWFEIDTNKAFANLCSRFNNTDSSWIMRLNSSGDRFRIDILENSSTRKIYEGTASSSLSLNTRYNLIFTFTTNSLKVYLNGTEMTVGNGTLVKVRDDTVNSVFNAVSPIKLGYLVNGAGNPDQYWDGILDEWSYWNKVLTQSEVTELYNLGVPTNLQNHSAYADIIGWWRMGEDRTSNTTVPDKAGSNDLTLTNTNNSNFVGF